MSAKKIAELDPIPSVSLDDTVIIEQTIGATTLTHKGTVRQLIGSFSPEPTITLLTWDSSAEELEIKGDNILPTTLITVDDIPYPQREYEYGTAPNASLKVELVGLGAGEHAVVVKNFIHEATDSFTSS